MCRKCGLGVDSHKCCTKVHQFRFFNAHWIWQLSLHSLTKLFQRELKTTKHLEPFNGGAESEWTFRPAQYNPYKDIQCSVLEMSALFDKVSQPCSTAPSLGQESAHFLLQLRSALPSMAPAPLRVLSDAASPWRPVLASWTRITVSAEDMVGRWPFFF